MVLKQKNPYWTAKAKEDLKEITKYYKKEILSTWPTRKSRT